MPLHEFAGREVVDRTAMVSYGIGRSTLDAAYANRAETGFPEKATREGRTDYWFTDEWETWFAGHQKEKAARLTEVDRSGDPDDLVYAAEAARIIGWKDAAAVRKAVRDGYLPAASPQDYDGRRPRWRRATLWDAADARTGHGSPRSGPRKSRDPKPATAAYASDERVIALKRRIATGDHPQAVDIAAEHHVSTRTAERWLRAATESS
ncbi:hypothetical protein Caci_9003 [Catenulispora acidiphila DSM 44928]|uniref:Uncharacterized protein n=1 Tax=Catenulispora acidiphila (strain DSM 44928 / JCM 14897 / NBRC 102108 / NRRL B-24433 / ID139908) TaxID=479433 RepID=C7Q5K5_CATAD|nr:hypothetical protein [Catenulispora acidiphila]ACU77816.1 hypothetical protein Caci_9003 [Catenulispora acidiphila DSM 44928]